MTMQYGVFLLCAVPMTDAGAGPPRPVDRRSSNEEVWETTKRVMDVGVESERLGYDYFFFTEHHFMHEGYEVIPNALMAGAILAERTESIKIGALCHVVPQWHPLRFAEDFSTMHNFSGGRGVLAVGRGTVPREAIPLGATVGSTDDPEKRAEQDAASREKFAEAIDVIELSLNNERFSYHGNHYDFPPEGIPDRGGMVEELTLTPRPIAPYERWQTITSPKTVELVARRGYGGVWWNVHLDFMKGMWEEFARVWEDEHGTELGAGEHRMKVVNVRIADTHEQAVADARPGFDEHWKFLGPYGRQVGFKGPDGKPASTDWIPTLEEGMNQRMFLVGTADEVAEQMAHDIEVLGANKLAIFPICLGDSYDKYEEQLQRFAQDVKPQLA
jgi:alkanesulfonate monooxygenase SsuD/methylene tetrahydromethanopterin reductase-like flavin-dependent oxidoreductase (luciferase family)